MLALPMRIAWMVWVLTLSAVGASPQTPFVGGERCRVCHRSTYLSWQQTRHAASLPDPVAETCVGCHDTQRSAGFEAVQCEACHGAGGNYAAPEVMIDPEKAARAGLVLPTENVCRRCHASGTAPADHADQFSMPSPEEWVWAVHRRRSAP